jgi:hypothetical protein
LFKGIGVAAIAEVDQNLQPLFRRQASIPLCISKIGLVETGEDLDDFLHTSIVPGARGFLSRPKQLSLPFAFNDFQIRISDSILRACYTRIGEILCGRYPKPPPAPFRTVFQFCVTRFSAVLAKPKYRDDLTQHANLHPLSDFASPHLFFAPGP